MKNSVQLFFSTLLFLFFLPIFLYAQLLVRQKKEIDPSKPTNLYTQVNANLDFRSGANQNMYGIKTNVQYAFNPNNLLMLELPLLYNDRTSYMGISDCRVRFFNAVKRNINKTIIAIAPFADITMPTGNYEKGLGTTSWTLSAGCVVGLRVTKKLSLFPGLSYIHITKPGTELIPDAYKFVSNGLGLQFNASYRFTKRTFLFVNPTPSFLYANDVWKTIWTADISINKIITPNKFKVNLGFSPNFTNDLYTFKFGGTLYL
jgi:hypothetical protein